MIIRMRGSENADFKRCPRKWWWAWRQGLRPNSVSDALQFGTWVHESLAKYYCGPGIKRGPHPAETFLNVWDDSLRYMKVEMPDLLTDELETKYISMRDLGEALLTSYIDVYGIDEDILVISPEQTFDFTIKSRSVKIIYNGTFDLVYRSASTGLLWLKEHKTAKSIRTDHLVLDEQAGPYFAMATRVLRNQGLIPRKDSLHGIMYNFLRKGMPDPREKDESGYALNKDGSVSKRQPQTLFHRHPVRKTRAASKRQLERVENDALEMLETREKVAAKGESVLRKTPHWSCSRFCQFFQMCTLEEEGGNWKDYRRYMYTVEDPYADHRKSTDELATFEFG